MRALFGALFTGYDESIGLICVKNGQLSKFEKEQTAGEIVVPGPGLCAHCDTNASSVMGRRLTLFWTPIISPSVKSDNFLSPLHVHQRIVYLISAHRQGG